VLREEVNRRLREAGVHPDKSLGQHFLVDDIALASIIREAELSPEDTVLEVGAGLGTLTEALCRRAGRVIAYEPDERMMGFLHSSIAPQFPHLELREKYINRYELDEVFAHFPTGGLKIVTNLPYNITHDFIVSIVGHIKLTTDCVVMLQHEVAKRLVASPGSKAYGSLTVYTQTFAYAEELMFVSREMFVPVPNVDSQLVRIHQLSRQPALQDPSTYFRIVRGAFKHRRKALSNALVLTFPHLNRTEILRRLSHAELMPDRRGDTLSREEFITLAREFG
jgi:16S rRNA (adenine1518-N6/adenine1519-N6)-dimethyltransferase